MKPNIDNLVLEPCCVEVLQRIRDKIEAGEQLRAALIALPFGVMLFGNPVGVIFTILSTDWDIMVKAVNSVGPIVRNRCNAEAELHLHDHKGGKLHTFWSAMAESFR